MLPHHDISYKGPSLTTTMLEMGSLIQVVLVDTAESRAKHGVLACFNHAISHHRNAINGENAHDWSHRRMTPTPHDHNKWRF